MMRLAEGLARAGHDPQLQWFDRAYEWKPWKLRDVQAPVGTDLVHAGSWQGFAFRREDIPLVVTEHQYIRHPEFLPHRGRLQTVYHNLFVSQCVERSYRAADTIVAVSEHAARAMRRNLQHPVHVIHNWVDTKAYSPAQPVPRVAGRPFRLLFVGNPSRWKGADVLPELAVRLGSEFDIQCLGGLRHSFDARELPPSMRLLSRVSPEEMPAVYQGVDAVLVPTRYEAFGYVAVEAMACGLPVLGFDSTGTAEVCIHGETALLARMNDVVQLAAYARMLLADTSLCARLGEAGRQRVVAHFCEERAMAAYISLYLELIKGRPRRD
ncbi:glycosyltransferase family 4 protein [Dyella silvae]|uniref:glycosyltransferase family 4 protein n=1 Tax=Dyella silvae TaxID=2994424 RepID=UPI002264DE87|nr:glycosyltransferase family 4 protein [Dyella silvae]